MPRGAVQIVGAPACMATASIAARSREARPGGPGASSHWAGRPWPPALAEARCARPLAFRSGSCEVNGWCPLEWATKRQGQRYGPQPTTLLQGVDQFELFLHVAITFPDGLLGPDGPPQALPASSPPLPFSARAANPLLRAAPRGCGRGHDYDR